MKNNKKCLSVLSTAAMGTLIATALASGASAKTTDVIATVNGQNVKFGFSDLNTSYEDKVLLGESPLYDTFASNTGVVALKDDPNGYVDFKAVKEAAENAFATGEEFALNTFTETTKEVLPEVKVDGEWKDGKIVPVTEDLKVESVSAITTTGVDVAITPLTENKDGVTVRVVNGAGQEVAVEAQNVLAGVTTLNFKFVKPVTTADLDGVWTVNGVKYSFTEIKLVADINSAVAANNQVALLNALNAAKIENVNADKIGGYLTAINGAATKATVADIQKIINDANKTAGEEAAEATLVKSVQDAKTQVAVLDILKANFERVNPDWIVKYTSGANNAAGIKIEASGTPNVIYTDGSDSHSAATKVSIQTAIDAVNAVQITETSAVATTSADQAKVTSLIQTWTKDDVTPDTTKADAIKASQIKEAIFKVQEATTENALYSALIGLANLDSANLKVSDLNAKLTSAYLTNKPSVGSLDTTANIKTNLVAKADTEALKAAMGNVATKFAAVNIAPTDATKLAEFKASLQKVADVTSHKTVSAKFDMSIVKDENLAKYAAEFAKATAIDNTKSVADLVAKINTVNDAQGLDAALKTINDTKSTAAQVRDALLEIAVVRNTGSSAPDAAKFINLIPQARLEVAELVQKSRVTTGTDFADLDAIIASADGTGAVKTAVTDHAAELAKFNAIGDLTSGTVTKTQAALDNYANDNYMVLTTTQKLAVAEEINKLVHVAADGTKTPYNFATTGQDEVKTLAEANAIINAAIAAIK